MIKIKATCDFRISSVCKNESILHKRHINDVRKKFDGKFCCRACVSLLKSNSENKNELFFRIIDSEIKAYMLGVIAGDGAISKSNQLHIVAHTLDISTLKLFQDFISPKAKINKMKNSNCFYISISGGSLCFDICKQLNINPGKKSNVITVLKFCNDFLLRAFLRGFMDTDGSISNIVKQKNSNPYCSISSTSLIFLDDLRKICEDKKIKYINDRISLKFVGTSAINFLNYLYKDANVALPRKHALYMMAKTWIPQKGSPFRPRKTRKDKGVSRLDDDRYTEMYEKQRELNDCILRDRFGKFRPQ